MLPLGTVPGYLVIHPSLPSSYHPLFQITNPANLNSRPGTTLAHPVRNGFPSSHSIMHWAI